MSSLFGLSLSGDPPHLTYFLYPLWPLPTGDPLHLTLYILRASLTTEASRTIAAAIVGSRLDFCNSLLAGSSVSNLTRLQRVQNTLARVVALKPRFCHITPVLCIGFRFATKLVSKLLRLLSECFNLSSHPIFHLSSQDMNRREHTALLRLSQYAFLHVKPPWQPPNHFHLLLQIFGMHCQIICLSFQLFLLLEELSNSPIPPCLP